MGEADEAKTFLRDAIFAPVRASATLDPSIKRKVSHIERWIDSFPKVGDIVLYLDRFAKNRNENDVSSALRANNLKSFEDILDEFYLLFEKFRHIATSANDFIEGTSYTAYQILNFARNYDTRSGGILPIGRGTDSNGIVIKATLSGGSYPNEWLQIDHTLKYYMKSKGGSAKRTYKENMAVIESRANNIKIYVFLRDTKQASFSYAGEFFFSGIGIDSDSIEWFKLQKAKSIQYDLNTINKQLRSALHEASLLSNDKLQERLNNAPKKPLKIITSSTTFIRNPNVITKVLNRANGICECCNNQAPFKKRNGDWYLEVHHKIQLAHGGDDTDENAEALCPNYHREKHFG
jgi:5-methylcytosine-specific restriction protein A